MRLHSRIIGPTGVLQPLVKEVVAAIDSVHEILHLPDIQIYEMDVRHPFARYVPGDRAPAIELSWRGPHPGLSLTHEFGHLFDHALGNFGVYATTQINLPLSHVIEMAERSAGIREWRALQVGTTALPVGANMRQIEYWLVPQEVWARAYAQYIALRSGNVTLQRELQFTVDVEELPIYKNVQWTTEDFEPIAQAIDSAFYQLGWRP